MNKQKKKKVQKATRLPSEVGPACLTQLHAKSDKGYLLAPVESVSLFFFWGAKTPLVY
jgi:hypothetical protein